MGKILKTSLEKDKVKGENHKKKKVYMILSV